MSRDDLFNIASYLPETAARLPFKKAVIYPHSKDRYGRISYTHFTFRQLDMESDAVAAGLIKNGISKGVRTILMVRPSLEFFVLTFALFKAGAVPVVVDPGMGLKRMLECQMESRPEAFIGIPLAHVLRTVFPKYFSTVRRAVTVGKKWFWGGLTYNDIRIPDTEPVMTQTRKDDTAAILFTTGSTGPAKGVVYTHGVFGAQIKQIQSMFEIGPDEVDLPTFPLFALFDPALGMTAVIPDMDPTKPAKVNPVKIIEAINNHGVTNMFASPALLNRVGTYGEDHDIKIPSMRRVVSAGAPVHPSNIARFKKMLNEESEIYTPYGATEAVPIIAISSSEILSETGMLSEQGYGMCVGRPIGNVDVRIIKITDAPIEDWSDDLVVAQGDVGEITVKGEVVTKSYHNNPNADRISKIEDHDSFWHRMGDLGWMDSSGRIWFCGRKSHRVVTISQTLYTIPCEAIFNNHPAVFRSALVGTGPRGAQIPIICIELKKGVASSKTEQIRNELLEIGSSNPLTESIKTILFHDDFPVDIRHNSKIFREKLSVWAEEQTCTKN
ncbi:fatty acid CoA ligase family protein [Desulforegula conservatrix]|uniref:fatty acid CoA ligase family protein n=1 Tax=Desulforegula conservatrix TaxID=153026 RepID=UPI0004102B21|nr:fatty acid CoA ligase family protein [Desulforegula conservatrix]